VPVPFLLARAFFQTRYATPPLSLVEAIAKSAPFFSSQDESPFLYGISWNRDRCSSPCSLRAIWYADPPLSSFPPKALSSPRLPVLRGRGFLTYVTFPQQFPFLPRSLYSVLPQVCLFSEWEVVPLFSVFCLPRVALLGSTTPPLGTLYGVLRL